MYLMYNVQYIVHKYLKLRKWHLLKYEYILLLVAKNCATALSLVRMEREPERRSRQACEKKIIYSQTRANYATIRSLCAMPHIYSYEYTRIRNVYTSINYILTSKYPYILKIAPIVIRIRNFSVSNQALCRLVHSRSGADNTKYS